MKLRIAISTLWICAVTLLLASVVSAIVPVYDGTALRKYSDLTFFNYRVGFHDINTKLPLKDNELSEDMGRLPNAQEILTRMLYFGLPAVAAVAAIFLAIFLFVWLTMRGR